MGRGFAILIQFSILSRIKVAQSSSKGWQLSLQQKFEYARFWKNSLKKKKKWPDCNFLESHQRDIMISCSVLSSSKVAQSSCQAWWPRFYRMQTFVLTCTRPFFNGKGKFNSRLILTILLILYHALIFVLDITLRLLPNLTFDTHQISSRI